MEINKSIIEKLKADAIEIDAFRFDDVIVAINELMKYSEEDTIYKMKVNGKEIYSFMSEDEMYITMFGKTKEEYLHYKEKKAEDKAKCKELLETKFPTFKKLIRESCPKKIAEKKIAYMEECFEYDDWYNAKYMESWIDILEAAKTKPMREVQQMYYNVANDPDKRLFVCKELAGSVYSDLFINLIIEDAKIVSKAHGHDFEDEHIIAPYKEMAQEAKAFSAEAFKKQDAMAALKSRMRKPINEAKAQKTSNDLDAVLGEDSQKGKTTGSKQKD